ncbi:MAG: hypothetical protein EZS28_008200 [Streblomastix strix]|uniref:Uncharacterized protein n=1 Tax=Streblomastix strix TaxID=222440 RepID=A0A5J4WMR5_9EUKA|nr:MAG: hypothetical protein EZS28_008200 [Streblomastix strix]
MRIRGLKLKTGITLKEQQVIEDEIRRMDPSITAAQAHGGVFAISNPAARRRIYTEEFPNSLLQELYETNIRINNEGKLIGEKYMENSERYDQNINQRQVEPAMNLGSRRPVITDDQATDLRQSSVLDHIQLEFTLAQEKLSEAQRQKIESDIISSVNLNTVYDIGAFDCCRPPINDTYDRKPFETYDTGYKYDQFGNPIAYTKKPTQHIG